MTAVLLSAAALTVLGCALVIDLSERYFARIDRRIALRRRARGR